MKKIFITLFFFYTQHLVFSQVKILFDATKAESAANADWVIDADTYNVGFGNGFPTIGGSGTEANPQRFPTPAQSNVSVNTPEDYWKGGLSAWAIECVKKGYQVETLPIVGGKITYNDPTNAQDLSNYKIFVVCEPNILFTTAEKNALKNFVQNGGGLFMIGNHDGSDRNFDGADSQDIWNDFMATHNNPFGMTFDVADFSQTTTNVPNLPNDPLLNGSYGNVTKMQFAAGTTLTLDPTKNTTVRGIIYKTGSNNTGNSNVMVAYASYGTGRVVAIGDSSPSDDGSGDLNDTLYDGWVADASGNHRKLIMNATVWLANVVAVPPITLTVTKQDIKCFGEKTGVVGIAAAGGIGNYTYNWSNGANTSSITGLAAGTYTVTVTSGTNSTTTTAIVTSPTTSLSMLIDITNITCITQGKIVANAKGGTPTYTYKWTNGNNTTNTFTTTVSGNFKLTVTDANGCQIAESIAIKENKTLPQVTVTITNPSCGNFCAEAVAAANTTYTYLWSDGKNTAKNCVNSTTPIFNLSVTDTNNGCKAIPTILPITQSLPVATVSKVTNATNGQQNGGATLIVTGGTPPFTYEWRDANNKIISTTQNLTNVAAGIYTCIVKDVVGCTTNSLTVVVGGTTAINDFLTASQWTVSPNPTQDFLNIGFKNNQNVTLTLLDINGKILHETNFSNAYRLDMRDLTAGIYLLRISDGKTIGYKKVVKN
jgi:Secretion system C-terminal sorting domain/SprB repeat